MTLVKIRVIYRIKKKKDIGVHMYSPFKGRFI